ncbi:hypothetical protein ASPWEDRAFT_164811 [Aspergillus wentii DTO 134E9]|uniref:Alcohol dehydrogenase-like N-terminal domain-containing protein n=1 Tax=Aspergillus wentii DTO 134E9 TaxID=1073089 RepID=A0A1L9R6K8_ASPWE|nr:uncharacterized protein ASPWEDRAFT_164811 [Aspergillus wentii DTO 134E9]OJJ30546.1 hypothetical protein ASPWEDRAFT_164811 [Aspergillus wentii DTO 134E9]
MSEIPSTQRAIVTPEMGNDLNMTIQTIPVQEPTPGEVVIRILYTGICRSDASFSVGPNPGYPRYNHIAGHEGIGHVVKAHDPSLLGRLYGIRYLGSSCGFCTYCLRDLPTSCPFQLNTPKQIPGTFREYATVPISCLVPLPYGILCGSVEPALYATALCSGSTALKSLRAARLSPGDVVIVVGGAGAIGHLTGMIAKQVLRSSVIGVDLEEKVSGLITQDHQEYCDIFLGAPETHEGAAWNRFHSMLLRACSQLRGDHGAVRAAEAVVVTSSSFSSFQRLDEYVCDGGSIVCAGVPKGLNMISLPLSSVVERGLHLTGNLMGSHREALEVVEYIRTGQIKPRITRIALEDVPEQMQRMVDCQTVGKLVVCM